MNKNNQITNTRDRRWVQLLNLLLSGYLLLLILFTHVHIVDNKVIRHTHPFSSSNHTHTSAELQAFRELPPLIFTWAVCALVALFATILGQKTTLIVPITRPKHTLLCLLRGPPKVKFTH